MKHAAFATIALLGVVLMPSVALADRYDRGDRYRGHSYRHHDPRSSSRFSLSLGFSSGGYRDRSYGHVGYTRGYYRPHYYSSPVVVREHYYCPPPVVYVPPPRPVYYYDPCPTPSHYYTESRYYYGR